MTTLSAEKCNDGAMRGADPEALGSYTGGGGYTGTVAEGNAVTVTVAGLGHGGAPTIAIFDDHEGAGIVGNQIPNTTPKVGAWGAPGIIYDTGGPWITDESHSNDRCVESVNPVSGTFSIRQVNFANVSEVFFTFWTRPAVGKTFPSSTDTDPPASSVWKQTWFMKDNSISTDDNICMPTWTGGAWQYDGNSIHPAFYPPGSWWAGTEWSRAMGWLKGDEVDPVNNNGTLWFGGLNSAGMVQGSKTTVPVFVQNGWFNGARFPGWMAIPPPSSTQSALYDDIYLAVGANSACRAEITNNAIYTSSTNAAICTITSWVEGATNTDVTFTVRSGSFVSFTGAYIHIFDSNNAVIASVAV